MTNREALRLCSDENIAKLLASVSRLLVENMFDYVHIHATIPEADVEKSRILILDWLKREVKEQW